MTFLTVSVEYRKSAGS